MSLPTVHLLAATDTPPVQPFHSIYNLTGSVVPFTLQAERRLEKTDDGQWRMQIRAGNWLGEIRETTHFQWQDCLPGSTHYSYLRRGLGRKRQAELLLDRESLVAHAHRDGKKYQYTISESTTDKLSQTLGIQCKLFDNPDTLIFDVADERRREQMSYQVLPSEKIKTPLGTFDAIPVERLRENSGDNNNRTTTMWFAPALSYAMVKMIHDDDKGRFEMLLQQHEVTLTKRINNQ